MSEQTPVHAINWFEIPTIDMERAAKFYGEILETELTPVEMSPGFFMAMLPAQNGVGGAIVHGEWYTPSDSAGSLVYLNGGADLNHILSRVPDAGGEIIREKYSIGENGHVGFFRDSEGNRVGLHSMG